MAKKALIHQIEARERRGRWFGALATLLSMSLLLSGWVGLFAFLGANSAYGTFDRITQEWIPDTRSMELTLPDLSRTSQIYADSGEQLAELHDGRNSEPVAYAEIPQVMVDAILAAEDSEFFEHHGVDFSAIFSAAIDNIISDSTRGGSTITQQVVKNAFVGSEITIERKIREAFVSAEVERRFSKERILEFYLNSVYFGGGAYGVKAAAEEFFNKDLADLVLHEAAALAVLVRNPSLYNPRTFPELTLERRNDVIDEMLENEWITETEATVAKRRPLDVVDTPLRRGQADHVVAEVKRQLLNDPEFAFLGETNEERKIAIFGCPADDVACEGGGGLQIFTTINLDLQMKANEILQEWLPLPEYEANVAACKEIFPNETDQFLATYSETHSCAPTGALTMVDNHTGAVKVMASGLPFEFSQFDLAVQGRRNPGSSFKPFALVAALEQGYTLGHTWSGASPLEIECEFVCSPDGSNIWTVSNAGSSLGVITLEQATYNSVNTVYAQVSNEVGPSNIVDVARRMGVTESSLNPVLSIVLGTSEVSTLEMANAFSNFATNGLHADDYLIEKIVDHDGTVIYENEHSVEQVSDPAIFAAARRALVKVPTSAGTAPRANISREQGGKTGTHQSYLDAWYVGFTPEYSTAVWVGYESKQVPLEDVVINGQRYSRVFGGSVPAPIWAEFMSYVLADQPATAFPEEPANIKDYLVPPATTVPSVVGLDQAEATDRLKSAKLNVAVEEVPSLEPAGLVVSQSHDPGTSVPQGTVITIKVSSGETPVGTLPSFIGMTVDEALEAARIFEEETGVKVSLFQQKVDTEDPGLVGRVISTTPNPGTGVEGQVSVTLFVGQLAP
ncbi:MAG: transglycosylase domain-containing protein [Acidimicrobiia bacterium]|nr:transglycosylase domain-containing protein [Acidimicrobiia bacterium]MDH3462685.1 transglycosylase domain-containing protein [Acidimicrobiia bacterium]